MSQSPTNNALAIGTAVTRATKDLASLLPFPPITVAATVLLEVFTTTQALHSQQEDCLRLAQRCIALLADVKGAMETRGGEPPEPLKQSIAKFTRTLESLRDDMRSDACGSWTGRFLRKSTMETKIAQYNDMIDDAARSFQIVTLIHIYRAVNQNGRVQAPAQNTTWGYEDTSPIYFYDSDKPYYEFTNAASYPIQYQGRLYPTAEHLYGARKFLDTYPELAERIRNAPSPRAAIDDANKFGSLLRCDWTTVKIPVMEEVLWEKFTQHPALCGMLLATGNRELVDTSPQSAFWGMGKDWQGRNELGKALVRLRNKLRVERPWY